MRYALLALGLLACDRSTGNRPPNGGQQAVNGSIKSSVVPLTCGVEHGVMLTGEGVGDVRIGESVDSIRRVCSVTHDTTTLGEEALPERVVAIAVAKDTLNVTIDSGRVWRIRVEQPDLRTTDSLGVGSRLSDLLRDTSAAGAEGEGVVYVLLPSHCGLSFRIAHEVADAEHRVNWSRDDLRKLPQNARIDEVLVTGCQK